MRVINIYVLRMLIYHFVIVHVSWAENLYLFRMFMVNDFMIVFDFFNYCFGTIYDYCYLSKIRSNLIVYNRQTIYHLQERLCLGNEVTFRWREVEVKYNMSNFNNITFNCRCKILISVLILERRSLRFFNAQFGIVLLDSY